MALRPAQFMEFLHSLLLRVSAFLATTQYIPPLDIYISIAIENPAATAFTITLLFLALIYIIVSLCIARKSTTSINQDAASSQQDDVFFEGDDLPLPTVIYREVKQHRIGNSALECAVCLTEFEDDEPLCLLPACPHAFHPDCIGPWVATHLTCPLCRSSIFDDDDVPVIVASPEPTATMTNPSGSGDEVQTTADHETMDLEWLRNLRRTERLPRSKPRRRINLVGRTSSKLARAFGIERFALWLPEQIRRKVFMTWKRNRSAGATPMRFKGRVSMVEGQQGGGGGGEDESSGSKKGLRFGKLPTFIAKTVTRVATKKLPGKAAAGFDGA